MGRAGVWEGMTDEEKYGDLTKRVTPRVQRWFREMKCTNIMGATKAIREKEVTSEEAEDVTERAKKIPASVQRVRQCESCGKKGHKREDCWGKQKRKREGGE